MAEYKVNFSGFAFVEADSKEEAEQIFYDGGESCSEYQVDDVEVIG